MELVFYIGIALGLTVGALLPPDGYNQSESRVLNALAGGLISFIITGFMWFMFGMMMNDYDESEMVQYRVENEIGYLVALKDGQSTSFSGNFFLGIGSISGGGTAYYGYQDLGDNKYKQVKFNPSETTIVEDIDSLSTPYFVEIREIMDSTIYKEKMKWDPWVIGPTRRDDHIGWEIHIPKGSIVQNFNLDLE